MGLDETKQRDVFFGPFSIFPGGGHKRQKEPPPAKAMNIQPKFCIY